MATSDPPDRRRSGPRYKPTQKQQAAAERRVARERFRKARIAEREYEKALANVGRQAGVIINGYAKGNLPENHAELDRTLTAYSNLIEPWAYRVTERMQAEVGWRDLRAWRELSVAMGVSLAKEIAEAPIGPEFRRLMGEQVHLIKSIPLEAGQRVHELTTKAISEGTRYEVIMPDILASGKVAVSRARLIARTETARTSSVLTQTRAEYVGSTHYVWRTMEDEAVRESHRKLNGKTFAWTDPPVSGSQGERSHPGQIYNCRCYPEPVLLP